MFSYYGRKKRMVKLYPEPKYNLIIEPFAGSAAYSMEYFNRDVMIVDKYPVVIAIWKYLQTASPNDILSIPIPVNGQELCTLDSWNNLCIEEQHLLGFCANNGSVTPKNFAGRMNFNSWHRDRTVIANNLYKIKHWKILCADYSEIPNQCATWFIDPPYQVGGNLYKENKIDYDALGVWCKERNGQAIVCENGNANWLSFEYLSWHNGQRKKTKEVMWTNDN